MGLFEIKKNTPNKNGESTPPSPPQDEVLGTLKEIVGLQLKTDRFNEILISADKKIGQMDEWFEQINQAMEAFRQAQLSQQELLQQLRHDLDWSLSRQNGNVGVTQEERVAAPLPPLPQSPPPVVVGSRRDKPDENLYYGGGTKKG